MMKDYLESYDFNLPLWDAFKDPAMSMTRRLIAAVAMKQSLDDAYFGIGEIVEAFEHLVADAEANVAAAQSEGADRIAHMLRADGDDFQRRVYYLLSETPVEEALGDLRWLMAILEGRAKMYRVIEASGAPMPVLPGDTGPIEGFGCLPYPY